MYTDLEKLLRKPALYQKSAFPFWDDPHISAGMLAAHLDPATDAASRRPETIERSVAWIAAQISHGAALLDLGCGPGLYTKLFAERGFSVTGLDISPRSLAYAREQDKASRYLQMDYLSMDFDQAFDAVTLIWCDYGALVEDERRKLLIRVHKALKTGGLFLLDVFTPLRYENFSETRGWQLQESGGFWSPRPHILLSLDACYPGHIGLSRYVVIEEGAMRDYNIWDTTFTPETLRNEVEPHGFSPRAFYADMKGNPFDPAATTLCAVLQKR